MVYLESASEICFYLYKYIIYMYSIYYVYNIEFYMQ